jgi:AraC-like DNA-binding protein
MLVAVGAAPRLLRQAGVDPAEVALEAGIDSSLFADPAAVISFDALDRYLVKCVQATRCPHFSLLLGAEEGFANLGMVGRLVEHSPTVASALRNLSANFHHYELGATVTLVADDDTAVLEYAIEQRVTAPELIADGAMAIAVGILRHMCGPRWAPIELQLRRSRPARTEPYRRILGERVRYGCPRNALLFPAQWLSHPLRGAAPDLRRFFRDQLAAMGGERPSAFPARLRGIIRSRLLGGTCASEDAARALAVSRRTLHRRLAANGTTFERELDEVRYDIARQMLEHSSAPMLEITASLSYANSSAFTRAFRRWSGHTPTEWRKQRSQR